MHSTQTITDVLDIVPWSQHLYHDAEEFWSKSSGLHHAYLIYRTLKGDYKHIFQPDAVFYVGKSPTAYLKKVKTNTISDEDIRQWQRFLWNQAVVPFLIVKSPTKIYVYTAYTKPEKEKSEKRIEDILDEVADTLELDQLWTAIESGMIYEQKPKAFDRNNSVDQYLLRNLNSTALKLAQTQTWTTQKEKEDNLIFAHYFLTRLLFVCYLIERGMVQGRKFEDEYLKKIQPAKESQQGYFLKRLFKDVSDNKKRCDLLCKLFEYIKVNFNGSLFPNKISEEKKFYTEEFIEIANDFLQGHDTGTGQMVLGFWAYDFSVIPIETISAIWESFLGEQGKLKALKENIDSRRESGAYYTPLHLAELTVDIALKDIEEKTGKMIHELKVLDPACGSGVFLVSLFGRIAESYYRKIRKNTGIEWARKLKQKLNQLYGIDISPTSCHITCFSLYLAYLEWLDPNDIEYLLKYNEKLPPLIANTREDSWNTIYYDNIFNPELALIEKDFDIIIGNPPWVSRGKQKDPHFLNWLDQRDSNVYGPEKQIAHGFMWETPKYLSDKGVACLLLPASVLFNEHTNEFQKEWFNSFTVERVVNFSDLRFILFSGADHPCVAICFSKLTIKLEDRILYESPKTDAHSQKAGPVYVREEDTVLLRIQDIIYAAKNKNAPIIWKSYFWGSWRDHRLLSRLNILPKLQDLAGKTREKGKRFDKSLGVQLGNQKYKGWWNNTTLYIKNTDEISIAIVPQDCTTVKFANIPLKAERPRKERLFEGPKVLISRGSLDMKVAFCNFKAVFQNSFHMIIGKKNKDEDLLRFLSIVIKSDVIQYYLWHTSSNWGIERDIVVFYELLSLPFFLPEDAVDSVSAKNIVEKVAKRVEEFEKKLEREKWFGEEQKRKNETETLRKELEPLIREYYNIDEYESMLIDDTLQLAVKSIHPHQEKENIPTLQVPDKSECETYTQALCEMLNNFGEGSKFKVNGKVYRGMPYSVVHISLTDRISKSVSVSEAKDKLAFAIKKIEPLMQENKGRFVFCQNLKVFDGDSLYILKPMQMRFWSRTAALNDADEIAGAIIKSRRES